MRPAPLLAALCLTGSMLRGGVLAGQVARVTVEPAAATLIAGNALRLTATAFDAAGRAVPGAVVRWHAAPDDAVTVDSLGVVRAWHPAEARVTAVVGGRAASAIVRIEPRDPAALEVEAEQAEIPVGGTTRLIALARDADLAPLEGTVFSYRSGDDRVAVVNPAGVVTGRAEGSAILAVQVGTLRREVQVRVVAARVARLAVSGPAQARVGEVIRLRAIAEDRRNLPVANPPVQWSVADAGASIDRDGAFLAEQPGTYRVTVTSAAVAGTHTMRVTPRAGQRVADLLPLPAGEARGLRAVTVARGILYGVGPANRLYTYDLADPSSPRLVDSVMVPAGRIAGFAIDVQEALAVITADGDAGLTVLSLRDPGRPRVITSVRRDGLGAVALAGRHAFVAEAGTGALRVISLAEPAAPREVAVWRLGPPAGIDLDTHRVLSGITVADGLAYLAYGRDGVVILDVGAGIREGTPERPRLVSQLVPPLAGRYPPAMRVGIREAIRAGEYLFLGEQAALPAGDDEARAQRGAVRVVLVRDPRAPVLVGSYDPGGEVRHLTVSGDTLLVAAGSGGVRVVEVAGELRGRLAAQQREPAFIPLDEAQVLGSARAGAFLYLADVRRGLRVVRLPDATLP